MAIPRGGVQVALEVAQFLRAELSLLVSRKLPFPDQPESGFGAIAEDGCLFIDEGAAGILDQGTIGRIIAEQSTVARERVLTLRHGEPLPEVGGRTVILVDDGIAMGSTMRAAIALLRKQKVGRIVVAVPVCGQEKALEFRKIADEVVALERPTGFRAVAEAYLQWVDVSDEDILKALEGSHLR